MVTRRLWWAAAALLALGACDSPQVGTDGGDEDGGTDVCEGLTLCTTAGTSCRGDSVVTCAANADGCMVETTAACAADETCEVSGGAAECVEDVVDPCEGVPAAERCTAEGRSCDGDTLSICAANTDGCLVIEETDCAAGAGVCDESGAMPMCVFPVDPCDGIADACTTPGTSCDGDNLVTCAPNAFGCLVATTADCASRAGGTCDDTATAECTFTGDPCDGITQCAAAGVSCDGPELVACAEDAFGCLVEARTDCTDAMFGFCDADGAPAMCSTAATDPCMGLTQCGTEATRACSGDDSAVETCAPNAFGCFVAETTTCAAGDVCSDAGEMAVCVDACSLVDVCPSATYCDGADVVTCAADSNGCLVESDRTACPGAETCDATTTACVDLCPTAEAVVIDCASGTINGDTADGTATISEYECTSYDYASNEQVWRFRNATRAEVTITSTRLASSGDFDLYVLEGDVACDAAAPCIDSSTTVSATETVEFVAEPGVTSYVVYDRFSTTAEDTSAYTLEVTCTPIVCGDGILASGEACDDGNTADGDGCSASCALETGYGCGGEPSVCYLAGLNGACDMAAAITGDTIRGGEDLADGGPRSMDPSCGGSTSTPPTTALYYSVTVPANTRVDVTTDSTPDIALFTQDACTDTECTFSRDTPESLSLSNTTAAPVTHVLGVMGWSASTTGTFDIAFDYTTLASNASCAGAVPVGAGVTGADVRIGGAAPTDTTCSTSSGGGSAPVLYYSVTIPANSATTLVATPTGTSWDISLRSLGDCDGTCLSIRDVGFSGTAEQMVLANTSGEAITRLIAVGGWSGGGTFDLSATNTPYAANATCAGATALGAGVTGVSLADGGPAPTGGTCGSSPGPVLYYAVDVPANSVTTVTGTPTGTSWDLTLRSLDDCSGACVANIDAASSGGTEAITLLNTTGSAVTRLIAVGADSTTTFGTFDLSSATVALAANGTCDTATAVSGPTSFTAVDSAGGGTPLGGCTPLGGTTLYYSVTVPPSGRVTATVVGAAGFNPVIKVRDSCAATSCTATNATGAGGTEVVSIDNVGTMPITRILAVNGSTSTAPGQFDLTFAYGLVPYTPTPITAACVTTGTWTSPTRSSTGAADDANTPIAPLPFAFTYYGGEVTHYSANVNGIAQLWTSATGTQVAAFTNARLPSTSTPNGVVAAFWDDLYMGTAFDLRTQTTGTAGSQVFVIEWVNARPGSSGPEFTFQAHFYEGTNVIEYHYCSVGTGDRASGSEATIGVENLTGTEGVTISHNTAGAVATGGGYRLTPN